MTGNTQSGGWATAGAYDGSYNGGNDAFVVKFSGLVELFPGDTNGDGKVDFQDLVALAQNYGGSGKTRAQGDVNGDGNVDFQDLVILAQNYGNSLLPAASLVPAARPEQLEEELPPPPFSAPAPASGALPTLVPTLHPRARRVRSLMNRG